MSGGYEIRCGGLGSRFDVLDSVGRCHGCFGLKWSHVLSFLAKEVLEQSGGGVVDLIGDEDPTDEDGDTKVSVSLGPLRILWRRDYEHEPGFELLGSKMVEMGQFRIIREKRIASYKGYRGGGVEVMCRGYGIRCGGLGSRFDVLDGVGRCHGCFGLKWSHMLSFLAKEVLEQVSKLL
nr:hypothetical protein [Tanacetum cinerariifolium]